MKKKKLVVYALSAALLLSGCSLSKESVPKQVIEPVISMREEATSIGGFEVLKSIVTVPSTLEEKEEVLSFIETLEGDNQVVVYHAESRTTKSLGDSKDLSTSIENDQMISKEIFDASLKENPMVQIYYCGSSCGEEAEKSIALYYPNVTYVEEGKEVNDIISIYYRANYVVGTCITGLRSGVEKGENFDFEGTIDSIKGYLPDIEKQEIIDGLETFGQYIENTSLFQKCEELSSKAEEALKPYVEAAIPKVESAWNSVKPYIEEGKDKVAVFYEDIKPGLSEAYEDATGYVKSILGK